jgi:hypothetical protein
MIELKRTRSRMNLSPTVWMLSIELARVCGWNPCGTRRVDGTNSLDDLEDVRHLMTWRTEYLSSDGQTVTAPDAGQLADALQRAAKDGERILGDWSEGRSDAPADVRTTPNGFRWFMTGDGRNQLNHIAEFCRGGAFQIF